MKYSSFLLGITATLWQIILFRESMTVFYGNELIIGLLLCGWLLFFALGCKSGELWKRSTNTERLALLFLLHSLLSFLAIKYARILLQVPVGEFIPLSQLFLLALPIVGVPCFILGLWFERVAHALSDLDIDNPAAVVYTFESFGAVLASLLFTMVLTRLHSNLYALAVLWLIVLVACSLMYKRRRYLVFASACLILILGAGARLETGLNAKYWQSLAPGLRFLEGRTTRYGELAVLDSGGDKLLYCNGIKQTLLPDPLTAQTLSALILTQHPWPCRILLIGGGLGGLALQLARRPDSQVLYLEQDGDAFALAARYGRWETPQRCRTLFGDGRRYLLQTQAPFDVIVVNVGRPTTALVNRYYTSEFFALAKQHLTPRGVLSVCGIPSAENYLGAELLQLNASLYHDLCDHFAEVVVLPGDVAHFFAARQMNVLSTNADTLIARYQNLQSSDRYFHPAQFSTIFAQDRLASRRQILSFAPAWRNSDFRPINYFIDMKLWLKQVSGSAWFVDRFSKQTLLWTAATLAGVWLAAFVYRPAQTSLSTIILLAGFAGMSLNLILLFMMQNLFGYVYEGMGLALAAFMSGLAMAASAARKIKRQPAVWMIGMVALLMVLLLSLETTLHALDRYRSIPMLVALLFVSGSLTGVLFPLAGQLYSRPDGSRQTGVLYAADLAGGAIGAIVISGAVIPLYGYSGAGQLLSAAGMALFMLALVLLRRH